MKYGLNCITCGKIYPSTYNSQICKKCHGILRILYDSKPNSIGFNVKSFWDYKTLLPDSNSYRNYEVGITKLIQSKNSSNLFLKLELENPTKSFKYVYILFYIDKMLR